MRLEFIEAQPNYDRYEYPYQVFAQLDGRDEIDEALKRGFVPTRKRDLYFQLARSSRVALEEFTPSSENRRILRKTEDISVRLADINEHPYHWTIGAFAKSFYTQKFGRAIMSAQKMKWIFNSQTFNAVFVFSTPAVDYEPSHGVPDYEGEKVLGLCPAVATDESIAYAYPFYDLSYQNKNTGLGMMLKAILHAREVGKKHIYLGTLYTPSSLYKTQFAGFEWFDGQDWDKDIKKVKALVRGE